MKLYRWLGFFFAIGLGLAAGLLIGWVVAAPAPQGLGLEALRSDYRADMVLMVAETYRADHDISAAYSRLSSIAGEESPFMVVQETILLGQQYGYAFDDIQALATLSQVIQGGTGNPTAEATP